MSLFVEPNEMHVIVLCWSLVTNALIANFGQEQHWWPGFQTLWLSGTHALWLLHGVADDYL